MLGCNGEHNEPNTQNPDKKTPPHTHNYSNSDKNVITGRCLTEASQTMKITDNFKIKIIINLSENKFYGF